MTERESAIAACSREMEKSKKEQLEAIKAKYAQLRQELQSEKTLKLDEQRASMRSNSILSIKRPLPPKTTMANSRAGLSQMDLGGSSGQQPVG